MCRCDHFIERALNLAFNSDQKYNNYLLLLVYRSMEYQHETNAFSSSNQRFSVNAFMTLNFLIRMSAFYICYIWKEKRFLSICLPRRGRARERDGYLWIFVWIFLWNGVSFAIFVEYILSRRLETVGIWSNYSLYKSKTIKMKYRCYTHAFLTYH